MMYQTKACLQTKQKGSVLIVSIVCMMVLMGLMSLLLVSARTEALASQHKRESLQALYDAFGMLEQARVVVCESDYTTDGRNAVVQEALDGNSLIAGTNVSVEPLTGTDGSWFKLTARSSYDNGDCERVVSRIFREKDYFSSFNLFVSEDPVGIAGSPIGPIHTNKQLQFYFPNGLYRHSLTAAEGAVFRAGATEDNTSVVGPFNPNVDPINLTFEEEGTFGIGGSTFGINTLKEQVLEDYSFPADRDVSIQLSHLGSEQTLSIDMYTQPRIDYEAREVLTGYNDVNPHEVEYVEEHDVIVGYETKTRDRTEYTRITVPTTKQVPVYREEEQEKQVPVYKYEPRTREVPVYGSETRTREVEQEVWVEDPIDLEGSTAVAGDGGTIGHYETIIVEETYTVQVITGYEEETYYVKVLDYYDTVIKIVQVVDHYEEVETTKTEWVAETVQEEYESPIYETQTETKTKIVYDQEPVYETVYDPVYVPREKVEEKQLPFPENGIIFAEGDIISVSGDVVEQVTIATEGSMKITGNLVYRDCDGDPAYLNGDEPDLPYEPNPDYENSAVLGLIARNDILYTNDVPDNFEINASMLSLEGRVGIEGIELNGEGEVVAYNKIMDQFSRLTNEAFGKSSIRRLGGITTCRRPVDSVIMDGRIRAGFQHGRSAFDTMVLACPPPCFMEMPVPRFFATQIQQ